MKKLILFLLFFVNISLACSQNFIDLLNEYEDYCEEIVTDTLIQEGTIFWENVPVLNNDGKIIHYSIGNPSTIWSEVNCPDYKHDRLDNFVNFISVGNNYSNNIWIATDTLTEWVLPNSIKTSSYETEITRKYICECKRRQVQPWSEDFWNWIKQKQ